MGLFRLILVVARQKSDGDIHVNRAHDGEPPRQWLHPSPLSISISPGREAIRTRSRYWWWQNEARPLAGHHLSCFQRRAWCPRPNATVVESPLEESPAPSLKRLSSIFRPPPLQEPPM